MVPRWQRFGPRLASSLTHQACPRTLGAIDGDTGCRAEDRMPGSEIAEARLTAETDLVRVEEACIVVDA